MLKGYVFKNQVFTDKAFAHFIYTFLGKKDGITKGCQLSNTTNSVTIDAGLFCVAGRFMEILSGETISNIENTGYYQLICEIDLNKENTSTDLNQAEIKLIKNSTGYQNLTKEDLDGNGKVYQFEFARFKVESTGITSFTDTRTFLDFSSIYQLISDEFDVLFANKEAQCNQLIESIETELNNVERESVFLLKNQISVGTSIPTSIPENGIYIQYFE